MATVPSPRLSEGHVDANDVIPSEDDDLPQVLAYYVAIPLSLAVFITVLVVLLCMRKEHVAIDERRQTIDVEGQWTSSNPQRPGHKPEVQQKRTQNGSVNPAYETHQENAPAPSARPIVENESNGNAQRDDVDASGRKTPLMPPTGKNANVQKEDRSFIEDKYGLPPTPKPPQRNHVEKPRSSTDHLVRPRGRPTGLSYDSAQHAQMVASLDASPAFQRLKYGTQRSSTLRRSHKYGENDVQLSRFRTLRTDFNDGIEVGNPRRSTQHRARYHTLDMSSRTSRRSQRSREAEQEWARKNHLTINKGKKLSRRHSKSFRSSRSAATSMEDLSASGRSSVWSLNVAHETRRRPSNTLSPSPYKLQVQNSIRPNKRVEYRQGIRTKRKTHMLSNSLRRQSTKRKDKSQFGADVSGDSPSFYMGFDVPLPPSNPLDDIPEQMQAKLPRDSDAKTSSLGNGIPTGSNPQVTRLPVPLGERAGDRSVSVKSEHPYEEIRFQKKENQNADADTSEKRHGLAGCLTGVEHG